MQNKQRIIIISFVILALVGAGIFGFAVLSKKKESIYVPVVQHPVATSTEVITETTSTNIYETQKEISFEELMDTSTWKTFESEVQNFHIKLPLSIKNVSEKKYSTGDDFTQFDIELNSQLAELNIIKRDEGLESIIYRSYITDGGIKYITYADILGNNVKGLFFKKVILQGKKSVTAFGGWEPSGGEYMYKFVIEDGASSSIISLTLKNYAFCVDCDLTKNLDRLLTLSEVAAASTKYPLLNDLMINVWSMISTLEKIDANLINTNTLKTFESKDLGITFSYLEDHKIYMNDSSSIHVIDKNAKSDSIGAGTPIRLTLSQTSTSKQNDSSTSGLFVIKKESDIYINNRVAKQYTVTSPVGIDTTIYEFKHKNKFLKISFIKYNPNHINLIESIIFD